MSNVFNVQDILMSPEREAAIGRFNGSPAAGKLNRAVYERVLEIDDWSSKGDKVLRSIDARLLRRTGVGLSPEDFIAKDSDGVCAAQLFSFEDCYLALASFWKHKKWFTADHLLQSVEGSKPYINTVLDLIVQRGFSKFVLAPYRWKNDSASVEKIQNYLCMADLACYQGNAQIENQLLSKLKNSRLGKSKSALESFQCSAEVRSSLDETSKELSDVRENIRFALGVVDRALSPAYDFGYKEKMRKRGFNI